MPNEQNEAIVRRTLDLLSKPELPSDYEQIVDASWDNHAPFPFPRGPQGFKALHDFWHRGFPDLQMKGERMFSDGDYVAVRFSIRGTHRGEFMGVSPTGKSIEIAGTGIHRFQNGKIAESWVTPDTLSLFRQLGIKQLPEMPQQRAA